MRSKSMFNTSVAEDVEKSDEDDKSRSLPLLPIVMVETPSGLPSPVATTRPRTRPVLSRTASLR